jgi:hypothetical protein
MFAIAKGGIILVASIAGSDAPRCGTKRIFDPQTHACCVLRNICV